MEENNRMALPSRLDALKKKLGLSAKALRPARAAFTALIITTACAPITQGRVDSGPISPAAAAAAGIDTNDRDPAPVKTVLGTPPVRASSSINADETAQRPHIDVVAPPQGLRLPEAFKDYVAKGGIKIHANDLATEVKAIEVHTTSPFQVLILDEQGRVMATQDFPLSLEARMSHQLYLFVPQAGTGAAYTIIVHTRANGDDNGLIKEFSPSPREMLP